MCRDLDDLDPDRWRLLIAVELDPELIETPQGRRRILARIDRLTRDYLHQLVTGRDVA